MIKVLDFIITLGGYFFKEVCDYFSVENIPVEVRYEKGVFRVRTICGREEKVSFRDLWRYLSKAERSLEEFFEKVRKILAFLDKDVLNEEDLKILLDIIDLFGDSVKLLDPKVVLRNLFETAVYNGKGTLNCFRNIDLEKLESILEKIGDADGKEVLFLVELPAKRTVESILEAGIKEIGRKNLFAVDRLIREYGAKKEYIKEISKKDIGALHCNNFEKGPLNIPRSNYIPSSLCILCKNFVEGISEVGRDCGSLKRLLEEGIKKDILEEILALQIPLSLAREYSKFREKYGVLESLLLTYTKDSLEFWGEKWIVEFLKRVGGIYKKRYNSVNEIENKNVLKIVERLAECLNFLSRWSTENMKENLFRMVKKMPIKKFFETIENLRGYWDELSKKRLPTKLIQKRDLDKLKKFLNEDKYYREILLQTISEWYRGLPERAMDSVEVRGEIMKILAKSYWKKVRELCNIGKIRHIIRKIDEKGKEIPYWNEIKRYSCWIGRYLVLWNKLAIPHQIASTHICYSCVDIVEGEENSECVLEGILSPYIDLGFSKIVYGIVLVFGKVEGKMKIVSRFGIGINPWERRIVLLSGVYSRRGFRGFGISDASEFIRKFSEYLSRRTGKKWEVKYPTKIKVGYKLKLFGDFVRVETKL